MDNLLIVDDIDFDNYQRIIKYLKYYKKCQNRGYQDNTNLMKYLGYKFLMIKCIIQLIDYHQVIHLYWNLKKIYLSISFKQLEEEQIHILIKILIVINYHIIKHNHNKMLLRKMLVLILLFNPKLILIQNQEPKKVQIHKVINGFNMSIKG